MAREYEPAPAPATLRLRRRILAALGDLRGPVRPQQRALSRALEAADCGLGGLAAQLVLFEVGAH